MCEHINSHAQYEAEEEAASEEEEDEFVAEEVESLRHPREELGSSVWTTFEESVDGECETHYELTRLPQTLINNRDAVPKPELCPGGEKNFYQLTKTKNANNCIKRASFRFEQYY